MRRHARPSRLILWVLVLLAASAFMSCNTIHASADTDMQKLKAAAERGDTAAQTKLGTMYRLGLGVEQDYAKALILYRKAADQGNAEAQARLGRMYENGKGVKKDLKEAAKWYRKAAELDFPPASIMLGRMYENGKGVKKDLKEAAKWYRRAADQGSPEGKAKLEELKNTTNSE